MSSSLPFDQLERHFHEPARLGILSLLLNSEGGMAFTELRDQLDLTFGNLDRHLKVLVDAGIVSLEKSGAGQKARTVVRLTDTGRDGFIRYLENLESILKAASGALKPAPRKAGPDLGFNGLAVER